MSYSSCSCLRPLVLALSLNLGTWTSPREWTLRGWVSQQCIVIATFLLSSWQQRSSHVSRFWVAINSFAARFWVYCDTVGFYHCVLGKSFVVVLGGLLLRSLFALLSFGWWDANLAGGSASCLVFLVCFLVVMICQTACDHRRPCSSFLTNSFFSCKDRALERDRPYQRKKKVIPVHIAHATFSIGLLVKKRGPTWETHD